jgi:hypothetical protein
VIELGGEELQILRQGFPWGTVREAEPYYAVYTKTFDAFDLMLARMMKSGESFNGSLFIHHSKFLFYR